MREEKSNEQTHGQGGQPQRSKTEDDFPRLKIKPNAIPAFSGVVCDVTPLRNRAGDLPLVDNVS